MDIIDEVSDVLSSIFKMNLLRLNVSRLRRSNRDVDSTTSTKGKFSSAIKLAALKANKEKANQERLDAPRLDERVKAARVFVRQKKAQVMPSYGREAL